MLTREEFTKGLAEDIRMRLDLADVSQAELARRTDLTEATISRYVHGQRIPGAYEYYKIMEVLK